MYKCRVLNWILGGCWRNKRGATRSMESTKFAEIFGEELDLARVFHVFVDAGDIGDKFAASFVTSIRGGLITEAEQKLGHVGLLRWNGETVILDNIDDELKARELLLSDYLKKYGAAKELVNQTTFLLKQPPENSDPLQGMYLLSWLGREFLPGLGVQDADKVNVAWEAACLLVHDGVACGAGMELGTLGLFRGDFTFEAHQMLIDAITAQRKTRTNRETGASVFRARRLSIRS